MINVVTEFIEFDTVRTVAYVYDEDGDLVTPTSAAVTITAPSGASVAGSAAMATVSGSTGIMDHYLYTDGDYEDGEYQGIVWVLDGAGETTKKSHATYSFKVG